MHLNFFSTENLFIYTQLQYEEALLRLHEGNWCILNIGSAKAVVLGSSKKREEDLLFASPHLPVVKRFSGGGSVLVDENTIFISFILSKKDLPLFSPEEIHRWAFSFYKKALNLSAFDLKENDYVIGDRKCAGNAQYIQKDRYVHHTSFLWDYNPEEMKALSLPKQAPLYRKGREHKEFLTPLKNYFSSKESFLSSFCKTLYDNFLIEEKEQIDLEKLCLLPHRKTTSLLS